MEEWSKEKLEEEYTKLEEVNEIILSPWMREMLREMKKEIRSILTEYNNENV